NNAKVFFLAFADYIISTFPVGDINSKSPKKRWFMFPFDPEFVGLKNSCFARFYLECLYGFPVSVPDGLLILFDHFFSRFFGELSIHRFSNPVLGTKSVNH